MMPRMATYVPHREVSKEAPDIAGVAHLIIDCPDPRALAAWWERLLGGTVEPFENGEARLDAPGLSLYFVAVPEPKTRKNRLHIDLHSNGYDAAINQALALGATLAPDVYTGPSWCVLRDPEGNEFCILETAPPAP
jgi:catechol 2,3-dioxygenase-like lactoylglutathione lyase family enzyme